MTDVTVIEENQIEVVSIAEQGPPGPLGPPGNSFEHVQVSASNEWIINHNFGYKPIVDVFTTGGVKMLAYVLNVSLNQSRIIFDVPTAGAARLM